MTDTFFSCKANTNRLINRQNKTHLIGCYHDEFYPALLVSRESPDLITSTAIQIRLIMDIRLPKSPAGPSGLHGQKELFYSCEKCLTDTTDN